MNQSVPVSCIPISKGIRFVEWSKKTSGPCDEPFERQPQVQGCFHGLDGSVKFAHLTMSDSFYKMSFEVARMRIDQFLTIGERSGGATLHDMKQRSLAGSRFIPPYPLLEKPAVPRIFAPVIGEVRHFQVGLRRRVLKL